MRKTGLLVFFLIALLFTPMVQAAGTELLDSQETETTQLPMEDHHPSDSVSYSAVFQSINISSTVWITGFQLSLRKGGAPTGTGYGRITDSTGTHGTDAEPTGGNLDQVAYDVSDLGAAFAWIWFNFTEPLELDPGIYCVGWRNPGTGTIDEDNQVDAQYNKTGGDMHDGNYVEYVNGDWNTEAAEDLMFKLYGFTSEPHAFTGAYYENGTYYDDTVTILDSDGGSFDLTNETKYRAYDSVPDSFYWDIGDGYSRYIFTGGELDDYTITMPEDTDAVYSFTVKDYSNRIGVMDSWLEAYRTINGTETLVTRQIIYDQVNAVPLNLVVGKTYLMKALFEDEYLHEFGYFTAGSDTTHTYSIVLYQWTDRAQTVYNDVTAEATRSNSTHIQLVYLEEIPGYDTLSANMTILFKSNGTQATKATSSGLSSTALHWYEADNETDYVAILDAEVEHFGDIQMSWVLDYTRSYNTFPQLDAFGDWGGLPVGDLIAITSSLIVMGCFSFVSRKAAPFMGIGTLAIFTRLGGASFTDLQLGIGFSLSLIYGLVMGAEA